MNIQDKLGVALQRFVYLKSGVLLMVWQILQAAPVQLAI